MTTIIRKLTYPANLLCFLMAFVSLHTLAEEPQFYGSMDFSLANATTQYGTKNHKKGTSIESYVTIGMKGSYDISDQRHIIYKLSVSVSNPSLEGNKDPIKAHNTYLGIEDTLGTVLVGRNNTVFKNSEGDADVFNGTNADMNNLVAGQSRTADSIWYFSPRFADRLEFSSTYLMTDNHTSNDDQNDETSKSHSKNGQTQYAITTTYGDKNFRKQPYYFAASYNKGISDVDAYRGIAQIQLGDFTLGTIYQHTKSTLEEEQNMRGNSLFYNIMYCYKRINFKAEYATDTSGLGYYFSNATKSVKSQDGTSNPRSQFSNIKMKQLAVGADHMLLATTKLYGHYVRYQGHYLNNNTPVSLKTDHIFTLGMEHVF
ncbi:porin [uncultured Shewanella sp.]|uniref:porin n=1 Tax=uncultured Shewanella sp. TaxID=173975 RepID=UPI0026314407|nr:porin [uncultured Shewanella sp.]